MISNHLIPRRRPNRFVEAGNILPSHNVISAKSRQRRINEAYALWMENLVSASWKPYLLTFMFRDLDGPPQHVADKMEHECYRVYATMLTRVIRHPRRQPLHQWPRWFCCHDRPIYKYAHQCKSNVLTNDGHHLHAAALLPPRSRIREDLALHFEEHNALYIRDDLPLARIHAIKITERPGYVVQYVRKQIGRTDAGRDIDFMLPRLQSEI